AGAHPKAPAETRSSAHKPFLPAVGRVSRKKCSVRRSGLRRSDGRLLPEVPTPPEVDPNLFLRARHETAGLHLDARTTTPWWLGERLDVGYAIDVLHPLAADRLK